MASIDRLVVDSSVFIALVVAETAERRRYAEGVVQQALTGRTRMVIPQLCHLEVASVITRRVRRRELDADIARDFLERFQALQLELVIESYDALGLHDEAQRIGCQVADLVFVRLASELQVPIATLDDGMRQACAVEKVPVLAVAVL